MCGLLGGCIDRDGTEYKETKNFLSPYLQDILHFSFVARSEVVRMTGLCQAGSMVELKRHFQELRLTWLPCQVSAGSKVKFNHYFGSELSIWTKPGNLFLDLTWLDGSTWKRLERYWLASRLGQVARQGNKTKRNIPSEQPRTRSGQRPRPIQGLVGACVHQNELVEAHARE